MTTISEVVKACKNFLLQTYACSKHKDVGLLFTERIELSSRSVLIPGALNGPARIVVVQELSV